LSGSGTSTDPYVISGWEIDAKGGGTGIYIGNTTKHLKIKDVHIFNASYQSSPYFVGAGVELYNTWVIQVQDSNISYNEYGVYIRGGGQNGASFTTITHNQRNGVYLYNTREIYVAYNNISYNGGGITMSSTYYCNIAVNELYKTGGTSAYPIGIFGLNAGHTINQNKIMSMNSYGIYISGSNPGDADNIEIKNNEIFNVTQGIFLSNANNTQIHHNSIHNNTENGIYIYNSVTNTTIENNTISGNAQNGIYVYPYSSALASKYITIQFNNISFNNVGINFGRYTSQNLIRNNSIYNNTAYGVGLGSSVSYTYVYWNSFVNNHGATDIYSSSHVQASDSGSSNYWNSPDKGNFWRDWSKPDDDGDGIVDNPYSIDGSANSEDNYPLSFLNQPVVPEFNSFALILISIFAALLLARKRMI
jgi:parallel beta-helix repeat protein